jgi:hypothetical protein
MSSSAKPEGVLVSSNVTSCSYCQSGLTIPASMGEKTSARARQKGKGVPRTVKLAAISRARISTTPPALHAVTVAVDHVPSLAQSQPQQRTGSIMAHCQSVCGREPGRTGGPLDHDPLSHSGRHHHWVATGRPASVAWSPNRLRPSSEQAGRALQLRTPP